MTNAEKFEEIFGIKIEKLAPEDPCSAVDHHICVDNGCDSCPINGFWEKEYKDDTGKY